MPLNILPGLNSCKDCSLYKNGAFVVPGEGPVPCDIMLIGEAPGQRESQQMRPFVGDAGIYLNTLLHSAGLSRDSIYITNCVKHWPGFGNPNPKVAELRACNHWLQMEIAMVKPKLIITLGAVAAHQLGVGDLKKHHGIATERNGIIYIPLYHPAAALHNPLLKPIIEADFHSLNSGLTSKVSIATNFIRGSLPKFSEPVAIDIETTSLDTKNCEVVLLAASTDGHTAYVSNTPIIDLQNTRVIVHNAAFDIPILHRYGVVIPWENVWDTMLSGYILGVEQLGLKARALRELNISMETFEEVGGGEYDSSKISLEKLVPYCGADAAITHRLYEKDLQNIKDNTAEDIFSVEMQLLPILLEISRRGVKIDTRKLHLFGVDLDYDLSEQVHKIHELTGYAFNVNSSEQLADVLFTKLKIKPRRRTKGKGHGSTDKESLVALQKHHPVIKEIIEYRSLAKLKGTYVDGLLDAVDPGGRIHTTFRQTGAITGRISSAKPNLQNIPSRSERGQNIRQVFIPSEGNSWVSLDYSQIEFRAAASPKLSGDKSMLRVFENNEDIHLDTSRIIYPKCDTLNESTKARLRVTAKTINFGLLFGLTDTGVVRYCAEADPPVFLTLAEAANIRQRVLGVRYELAKWLNDTKIHVIDYGWTETIMHRRRYYPGIKYAEGYPLEDILKAAINHPIQGSAADVLKATMVEVEREHQYTILTVHDELCLDVPSYKAEYIAKRTANIMVAVAEEILEVPVKVTWKIGKTWGEAH